MQTSWVLRGAVGVIAACLLLGPFTASVQAECDGPFPSFRKAAPTAREILMGRVVASLGGTSMSDDGRTSRFVLRGWSVLEDSRPIEVEIRDVQSQPCAGPIVARVGDEIAIAFGGHDFEPPQVVNAVAWMSGSSPQYIGVESISYPSVYELVGLVAPANLAEGPDGQADGEAPQPSDARMVILAWLVVAALALSAWYLWRQSSASGTKGST